ncbi:MAG: MazG-like family protein [Gemmatimonadales bacterium]
MVSNETIQRLLDFRRQREWEQFHSPKNLAIAIATEAAELLAEFRWTSDHDINPEVSRRGVEDELADVVILSLYLAHDLEIDLDEAVQQKLLINEAKYPITTSRGRARPENGKP